MEYLLALVAVVLAALLIRWRYRRLGERSRAAMIAGYVNAMRQSADHFGPMERMMIGDSILHLTAAPGARTFYFTVPGARSDELIPAALDVAARFKPSELVICTGVNDHRDLGRPAQQLERFAEWPGTITWVEIPNGSDTNAIVRNLAAKRSERFIPFDVATSDGIHPTQKGGRDLGRKISGTSNH